jgi:hypothetical protein
MNNLLTKLATIAATSAAISIVSVVEIPKAEAVSLSLERPASPNSPF